MPARVIPTQTKIANGNPGKRPEDVDLTREPQPDFMIPEMPDFLDEVAAEEWDRISELLLKNKLITEIDGQALAVYCQAWSRMIEAERQLKESSLIVIGSMGSAMANPLIRIINMQTETVFKYLQQFGLTPAARTKIKLAPGTFGDKQSAWQKFAAQSRVKGKQAA